MATVPKSFAADFELWAGELLRDGDTPEGIEEIRRDVREAFAKGGEAAEYWTWRIKSEADLIRFNHVLPPASHLHRWRY